MTTTPYPYRLPPGWEPRTRRYPESTLPIWLVAVIAGFRAWQKGAP